MRENAYMLKIEKLSLNLRGVEEDNTGMRWSQFEAPQVSASFFWGQGNEMQVALESHLLQAWIC